MIRESVLDWQELSTLYEHADGLEPERLRTWLAELEVKAHRLLPQLKRMLDAKQEIADGGFLEALPVIEDPSPPVPRGLVEGARIGPYRLLRHIGAGGMAEVWLAERADGTFERQVALKLLLDRASRAQQATFAERFRRERDILASLDHPNIARLLDAGVTDDGQPWLALDYVDGKPITAWCDEVQATIEERVRLFRAVLLAVEHAHARLVIHRDIKPSNVLVAGDGELRLLDFGIAKLLAAEGGPMVDTKLTQEGGRPLTPQYASPEQFLGDPLTTASDVYSLGVLLYEVLCGSLPYELAGKMAAAVELHVLDVDPPQLSRRMFSAEAMSQRKTDAKRLRKALRPDLDAIAMRALEKVPERRYESVGAMRGDLDRWLAVEPVLATIPSSTYRIGKFVRRNRVGVGIATATALLVAGAAAMTIWQSTHARAEAARALIAKQFLLDTFRLSDPSKSKNGEVSANLLLDESLQRANRTLADQPELHAEVLAGIAELDQHLNRYTTAQAVLIQEAQIYATLGLHVEKAGVDAALAENALRMGDLKSASAFLSESMSGAHEFASDLRLRAKQQEVAGLLALYEGNFGNAKNNMQQSLSSATAAFGGADIRVADALRGLAAAEEGERDFPAARKHIFEAMRIAAAASDLPYTVQTEIERARIEFEAGALAEALPMMKNAITRCDTTFGDQDDDCYFVRAQEALALLQTGDVRTAMHSMPVFLREARNDLSPQRQAEATIIAMRVLAANGLSPAEAALSDRLRAIGHPDGTYAQTDATRMAAGLALAEVALREKRPTAAEVAVRDLLSLSDPSQLRGAYRARALMLQGLALQLERRHLEALSLLRSAENEYVLAFGVDHTETLLCRLYQVPSLVAAGEEARATELIERTLPKLKRRMPDRAPVVDKIEIAKDRLSSPLIGARLMVGNTVFF